MSSTNRSKHRDSHSVDYYVTPVSSIIDFLMEFWNDNPEINFNGKIILDPCAGGDKTNPMSYPEAIGKFNFDVPPKIVTIDWRNDSRADIKNNFLTVNLSKNKYDVVITNPPFFIAQEVIEKSFSLVKEGGLVIMLLRLNFFGGQSRNKWWECNMPTFCYVHSKRMRFIGTKNTDSIEYMHAVWIIGNNPKFTKLRII